MTHTKDGFSTLGNDYCVRCVRTTTALHVSSYEGARVFICFNTLISSEEGEGGEGRGKATA
jgi:hypothetical protein